MLLNLNYYRYILPIIGLHEHNTIITHESIMIVGKSQLLLNTMADFLL